MRSLRLKKMYLEPHLHIKAKSAQQNSVHPNTLTMKPVTIFIAAIAVVQSSVIPQYVLPSENEELKNLRNNFDAFSKTVSDDMLEDAKLLVPELVQKYGYPCERHQVISQKGYIMEMHRIPHGKSGPSKNRPVVYLQHGLLSSSADWVITGPQKALGYILADAGYDVWMSNVRGNRYGRSHIDLDPDKNAAEFWDFSWHEIALEDVPVLIDYVIEQTGQPQIYYIGHSQGTTVFYVMCSEKPEYNDKIRVQFSMAPVGYMNNIGSPLLRFIAFFQGPLDILFQMIGIYEFLPNDGFLGMVGESICHDGSIFQILCTNTLFAVAGFNPNQLNATLLPVMMGHTPAGASTKQVTHYAQEVNSAKFRHYDHGLIGNLKHYGSMSPPKYSLSKVKAPTYLFYSRNDWMSGEKDVLKLYKELGNVLGKFLVVDAKFSHFDYMFGISANELVYNRLISLMKRH